MRLLKYLNPPFHFGTEPSTIDVGIYDAEDNILAEIRHLGWLDARQSEVSAEQDRLGNLFAAAPELYGALEKCRKCIKSKLRLTANQVTIDDYKAALEVATAVLKKARG